MVFKHLSDAEVHQKYQECLQRGLTPDDAFTKVYAIDCGMNEEDGDE